MKFALAGCGWIAKRHSELPGEQQIQGARLDAVYAIREERARRCGEKDEVPWFTDMHRMMSEAGNWIDEVSILTESGNHSSNMLELAKYGKHIIVEKPMALTLADVDVRFVTEATREFFLHPEQPEIH